MKEFAHICNYVIYHWDSRNHNIEKRDELQLFVKVLVLNFLYAENINFLKIWDKLDALNLAFRCFCL